MRVIAGTFRSRLLSAPLGTDTRPTGDRLRETLFNILGPRVSGCQFADLYAGTGAVGIEAISRGAEHVFFAENAPAALKVLRANLSTLGIHGGYAIEDRGTARLLERLTKSSQPLDLVYVDPPYDQEKEYTDTFGFFSSAAGRKVLASDALVVVEHATRSKFQLPQQPGCLAIKRTLRQGDTTLSFYQLSGGMGT
jgi:16S rRNA (guanine966-N2)-methyltransferase